MGRTLHKKVGATKGMEAESARDEYLEILARDKELLLIALSDSPTNLVRALYTSSGFFGGRYTSPYIHIDDTKLCALGDASTSAMRGYAMRQIAGGKVGAIFLVDWGDKRYILKRATAGFSVALSSKPSAEPTASSGTQACGFPDRPAFYLAADEYTNELLIAFAIETAMRGLKLEGFRPNVIYLGGFICKGQGYSLLEYYPWGNLANFARLETTKNYRQSLHYLQGPRLVELDIVQPWAAVEILRQVVVALYLLQVRTQFISADAKVANVFIAEEPADVVVQGIRLKAPFSCRIADYGKSSVSVPTSEGLCRLYTPVSGVSIFTGVVNVFPPLTQVRTSTGEEEWVFVIPRGYLEKTTTASFLTAIRHVGFPLYRSIDLYTFLVSFFMVPAYYYAIMTHPRLRAYLWDVLWLPEDLDTASSLVFAAMIENRDPSFANVAALIAMGGLRMRCSALNLVLYNLVSKQDELDTAVGL